MLQFFFKICFFCKDVTVFSKDVVFQRCKLSESFRLTREISSFINTCMLRENRIISNKTSGKKPKYVICDVYSSTPLKEFKIIFEELRIEPKDIFILAPSLKSNKKE